MLSDDEVSVIMEAYCLTGALLPGEHPSRDAVDHAVFHLECLAREFPGLDRSKMAHKLAAQLRRPISSAEIVERIEDMVDAQLDLRDIWDALKSLQNELLGDETGQALARIRERRLAKVAEMSEMAKGILSFWSSKASIGRTEA